MSWVIDLIPLPYTDAVVALGAAILGFVAGSLGVYAVLRERSLVGDALAHAALPGVCIAFLATGTKDPTTLLVGAAIAGLVGAWLIVGIERTNRVRPDAAIGVVLSGFFAVGIVLLTHIAGTGNANQAGLDRYLFGQAAGLQERDVIAMLAMGAVGIAVIALLYRPMKTALFDRDFAGSVGLHTRALDVLITALLVIAIVVGVRVVGAILMVALLITPSVAARQFTDRLHVLIPVSGLAGAAIGVGGALTSMSLEVPTGPVIVIFGFVVVVASLLFAPGRGIAWRASRLRQARRRAAVDGALTDVAAASSAGGPIVLDELASATGRTPRQMSRLGRELEHRGLARLDGSAISLTATGEDHVAELQERRRLWSLWLEHGWRLDLPDAREPDPLDLRRSIGDRSADRLLTFATAEAGPR